MEKPEIINAMSVDVEDYFQVSAFEKNIVKKDWENLPQRVNRNTNIILDLFDQFEIKATFFTLGWVAERYPELVTRIVSCGHELACHGYEHIRVTEQTPDQFEKDITKTKTILEDISGREVNGYRAASYSIVQNNQEWAHRILHECGFKYSSSVYPVHHDLYGIPDAPRFMYEPIKNIDFKEIPVTTIRFTGKNYPCGGGGFFRFYPYFFSKWALKRVNDIDRQSGIFYFHPWEIDPDQPVQKDISLKTRFRHYLNLKKMEARLVNLLQDFKWDTVANTFLIKNFK